MKDLLNQLLQGQVDMQNGKHTTFINERPSNRKLLMPVANEPPNPKCYVCSKVTLELKLDVGEATLGFLVKDVLKKKLGFNLPDITVNADLLYEEGDGLEPDEVATYERRLALRLQDLPGGGVRDNTMIDVEDFAVARPESDLWTTKGERGGEVA